MKNHLLTSFKPMLLMASTACAALTELTHKYLFAETEYLKFLVIAVTLDLITGIAKVWAKEGHKAITSKGFRMTILKFIQYGAFLIITHVLANVQVGETKVYLFAPVERWAYLLLLLIEIKSVYENIIIINHKLDFIKAIIGRIDTVIKSQQDNDPPSKTT